MNFDRHIEFEPTIELPAERGWKFLESEHQKGYFPSYISQSQDMTQPKVSPRETFSTIVIADTALKFKPDNQLTTTTTQHIKQQEQEGLFTFFEDRSMYPPDTDTTSLASAFLLEQGQISVQEAQKALDTILSLKDKNGLVQVWLSKDRPNRTDPVVGANALYLANTLGRDGEMAQTEEWLLQTLDSKAYLEGSRYYQSPDAFLYFIGRLLKFPSMAEKIKAKLEANLRERIGATQDPLDLSMRIILANEFGINNEIEKTKLQAMQNKDGSWPANALFRYGGQQGYFGSSALTTAFAIKALESVKPQQKTS